MVVWAIIGLNHLMGWIAVQKFLIKQLEKKKREVEKEKDGPL